MGGHDCLHSPQDCLLASSYGNQTRDFKSGSPSPLYVTEAFIKTQNTTLIASVLCWLAVFPRGWTRCLLCGWALALSPFSEVWPFLRWMAGVTQLFVTDRGPRESVRVHNSGDLLLISQWGFSDLLPAQALLCPGSFHQVVADSGPGQAQVWLGFFSCGPDEAQAYLSDSEWFIGFLSDLIGGSMS